MLCITAADPTAEETETRLDTSNEPFHEVRLDHSQDVAAHLRLIRQRARSHRILVTCRPAREGGAFDGPERTRISLLEKALEAGAWAVDMEWDSRRQDMERLARRFGPGRILVSSHFWQPVGPQSGAALRKRAEAMAGLPARWIKLAASVEDVADLDVFDGLGPVLSGRRVVLVPMGPAGTLGRVRYRRLGSAWTYVAAGNQTATAPGQIDLEAARLLRLEEPTHLLALIGGPSVQDSPGPMVYNEWLAAQRLPFQYLAAQTAHFPRGVAILRRLGLVGASVTMPHKAAALAMAQDVHPQAQAVGAANTLCHKSIVAAGSKRAGGPDPNGPEGWQALNTDVHGIRQALRGAGSLDGRGALVLGGGGAAAAAIWTLTGLGAHVTLAVRNTDRARPLARRLGCSIAPWSERERIAFDVLVNATPLGRDGESLPFDPGLLQGKVVFDMLLRPHPSPLVRAARQAGAVLVRSGLHMWVAQGRAQMRRWTGRAPDEAWMIERTDEILRKPG